MSDLYYKARDRKWRSWMLQQCGNVDQAHFESWAAGYGSALEHHLDIIQQLSEALQFLLEANTEWAKEYELAWPNNAIHYAEQALKLAEPYLRSK